MLLKVIFAWKSSEDFQISFGKIVVSNFKSHLGGAEMMHCHSILWWREKIQKNFSVFVLENNGFYI